MPAYTTVEIGFLKSEQTSHFIAEFYKAVQVEGVSFDKVFVWGCSEDMSLEEIIEWNQAQLDSNFKLGYDQGVSNDYRQLLLKGTPYTECRIFILNGDNSVSLHLIVPEHEVKSKGYKVLSSIAKSVITALPVRYVQTYDELSDGKVYESSDKSFLPVVEYFGFTASSAAYSTKSYNISDLNNGKYIEIK